MASKPTNITYVLTAVLVILGILIAITSWYIFPVCEMEGKFVETKAGKLLPMKCGYTARAEVGIGALVVLAGVALMAFPSRDGRRALGTMVVGLGAVTALMVTTLIGMCAVADHVCRIGTEPALILLGVVTLIVGLYMMFAPETAPS
jgi:hypothetical protein